MATYRFQSPNPAQDTGKTARFTVIRDADGFYWNQSLNTGAGGFEAYSSADYTAAKYLVSMIEGRKGQWSGTFPANVAANTVVTLQPFYDTTAGTPADSDLAAAAAADFLWDGTILYPYTGANVVQVGGVGPVETTTNIADGVASALAGSGINVSTGIVNGTVMELIRGDDYSTDTGRRITFTKIAGEPWPDDLTNHTITLVLTKASTNTNSGDATRTWTGTIGQATGDGQAVYFTPGITETVLALGIGNRGYTFDLRATSGSNAKTLRIGVASIRA